MQDDTNKQNNSQEESQEFYGELDKSKISGKESALNIWSFIAFWSILFIVGLILIIKLW